VLIAPFTALKCNLCIAQGLATYPKDAYTFRERQGLEEYIHESQNDLTRFN